MIRRLTVTSEVKPFCGGGRSESESEQGDKADAADPKPDRCAKLRNFSRRDPATRLHFSVLSTEYEMFEAVRNNKRVAQVILALLIVPFAFFGMDAYFSDSGSANEAARWRGRARSKPAPRRHMR